MYDSVYSLVFCLSWNGMICCKYGTHKHSGLKVEATIHHMLESHHCPFGTAEAPHGFNRAKIQYRVKHTHTPARAHTHTRTHIHTNPHSSFKAAFNSAYISCLYKRKKYIGLLHRSAQTICSVFSHQLSSVAFGGRVRLYTVSIGGENQEILFAFLGKKNRSWG